jgi:hypothetical protein
MSNLFLETKMSFEDLKDSLAKDISPRLVDDLLKDFVDIRRHYISSDYRSLLAKSGTFSETVAQILIYLSESMIISTKEIKINELEKRLVNANLNLSLKTVIPRMLITIYKLRSSRGGAHQSDEISPNYIDANYIHTCCNWIICELIRLYHDSDVDKAVKIIAHISKTNFPLLEEIDGETLILEENLKIREQILALLFSNYPQRVSLDIVKHTAKAKNPISIANALTKMVQSKLIHKNREGIILTSKGLKEAEGVYANFV